MKKSQAISNNATKEGKGKKEHSNFTNSPIRHFQAIFENNPLGMAVINTQLEYIQVNDTMCQLFGYSRAEFLKLTAQQTSHPTDFQLCVSKVEQLMQKEIEVFKMEKKYYKKDGSLMTVNLMVSSYFDDRDGSIKFITTLDDISQKKKHEIALKREQERSEMLIENSSDIITLMDKRTTILYESPAIERILGYTPEELIGTKAIDLVHPQDLIKIAGIVSNKNANADNQIVEYRLKAKDGTWRHLQSTGTNQLDNPAIQAIVFNSRDVTPMREAERALKESEELFRNLFEHSPIGVIMSDLEGRMIKINAQFCKMLGYEKSELLNRKVVTVSYPEDKTLESSYSQRVFAGEIDEYTIEKRFFRKDSSIMWGNLSISVIRNKKGTIQHIIAMVEDITDKKEAAIRLENYKNELEEKVRQRTAELKRSNEELSHFAYAASHDMKQPLRTITSFANLLKRRYKNQLDDSANEYINFIVEGTQNMSQLIHDLLEYARFSSDKESHFEVQNLNTIVQIVEHQLSRQISEHQVTIKYKTLPEKITIILPKMLQLLQNLVSNAIKFRDPTRACKIRIASKELAAHWQFAIQDNGIGIAPEHQTIIFQIFKKLHAADKYKGSGIGLATCKKIVEQHNGKIWVESEFGKGTTFFFTVDKNL